jgi:hypothetical protein
LRHGSEGRSFRVTELLRFPYQNGLGNNEHFCISAGIPAKTLVSLVELADTAANGLDDT